MDPLSTLFARAVIFPLISTVPPGQSSKPVVFEIGILSIFLVQSEGVGGRPTGTGKVVTLLSFIPPYFFRLTQHNPMTALFTFNFSHFS